MDVRTTKPALWNGANLRAPLAALSILLASIACIVFFSAQFDRPITSLINRGARLSGLVDLAFLLFAGSKALFSGVILLGMVWYAWFDLAVGIQMRAQLLVGTLVAYGAGVVSRVLQLALPTHPRPLHDPLLAFSPPTGVNPQTLNHWNSFPSDHAAVFFGLAYAIYRVDRKVGAIAFAFAGLLGFARVYLGYHYPTDVIGGGALGVFCVALCVQSPLRGLGERMTLYACRKPAVFYMLAFIVSYGIATLFDDAREAAEGAMHYLFHRV
jgi:membrane-associated phospholipid phosphatase